MGIVGNLWDSLFSRSGIRRAGGTASNQQIHLSIKKWTRRCAMA